MIPADDNKTAVERILEEQQCLTAVDKFARAHEKETGPAQERYYRDLIPLSSPGPGQQYGFEVDLDRCSGCQACVTACHSLNGLDDDESWRTTGLLHSDDWRTPYQATVTSACHHCVDPGCLTGCPVLAYDKDPVTGIVRHLDDQCIGCQYCVMKCPYEVPQYSAARGIVRKCDMCSSRLGQGEAPACVQACPSQAIRITLVETADLLALHRGGKAPSKAAGSEEGRDNGFLPSSPDPRHTVPTTRYRSAKAFPPQLLAGDHARVVPAHAHPTLAFMLVFSQMAVGIECAAALGHPFRVAPAAAVAVATAALGVGVFHLGQPLKAWRSFLGWRRSWFSREVIALSGFMGLAVLGAVAAWVSPGGGFARGLLGAAAAVGVAGVCCSAMVYVDTPREFWRAPQSFGRFLGTAVLLGCLSTLALASLWGAAPAGWIRLLAAAAAAATAVKLTIENRVLRHLGDCDSPPATPLGRTARLLDGELGTRARTRLVLGLLGGLLGPLLIVVTHEALPAHAAACAFGVLALAAAGELLERHLFFAAVAPAKMPGGICG